MDSQGKALHLSGTHCCGRGGRLFVRKCPCCKDSSDPSLICQLCTLCLRCSTVIAYAMEEYGSRLLTEWIKEDGLRSK